MYIYIGMKQGRQRKTQAFERAISKNEGLPDFTSRKINDRLYNVFLLYIFSQKNVSKRIQILYFFLDYENFEIM